jgi:site-specific recombinase XerD
VEHQRCAPSWDAQPPEPGFADASRRTELRHAHAVEMAREGVPLIVIQRQLGHSNLGITSVYLQGIDNAEIIETVHARRAPMIPVSASPRS